MTPDEEARLGRSARPVRSLVRGLDRLLVVADLFAKGFVGLALLIITAVLFVAAVGRYGFEFSFVGGEELARWLMVWMTFLGSYVLVREQRHITIDIALRMLPTGLRRWLAVAIGLVGLITMTYLAWFGYLLSARMLVGFQFSPVLPLPRGVLHASLPLGAGLMALGFLHMTLSHLLDPENARPLHAEDPVEDRG